MTVIYVLFSAGYLTPDPRMRERKKPGQEKARKKFTWYNSAVYIKLKDTYSLHFHKKF